MMVLMQHPQHGAMHVYTEAEVALNEKNGWKRQAESIAPEPPSPLEAKPDLLRDEVIPVFASKRGPGRPRKDA